MLLALSIILYILAALAWIVALYSKTWPATKGRLIRARVVPSRSEGQYSESPDILYEYIVRNRTYRSSLIRPGGDFSWSSTIPGCSSARIQLEEIINRGEPTVYYCPLFSRLACLRPGGFAPSMFLLVAAAICSVINGHWF